MAFLPFFFSFFHFDLFRLKKKKKKKREERRRMQKIITMYAKPKSIYEEKVCIAKNLFLRFNETNF